MIKKEEKSFITFLQEKKCVCANELLKEMKNQIFVMLFFLKNYLVSAYFPLSWIQLCFYIHCFTFLFLIYFINWHLLFLITGFSFCCKWDIVVFFIKFASSIKHFKIFFILYVYLLVSSSKIELLLLHFSILNV